MRTTTKILGLAVSAAFMGLGIRPASAGLVYQNDFTNLNDFSGGSFMVGPNQTFGTLVTSGGSALSQDGYADETVYANIPNIPTSGTVWVSWITTGAGNDVGNQLRFGSGSNPSGTRSFVVGTHFGGNWRIMDGNFNDGGITASAQTGVQLAALRINYTTNQADLWVNPTGLGSGAAPLGSASATWTTGAIPTFNGLGLVADDGAGFDELRIGTTWADVSPTSSFSEPTWVLISSGDWNVGANWGGTVPNGVDAKANLLGAITSARTIYSDTPVTVGTLRFDNANTYQIAGNGSLSIDVSSGSGSISVLSGSHKINIPLFIKDNTVADVTDGATLKISNPMTLVGGATLTKAGNGTLSIEAPVLNAAAATLAMTAGVTNAFMDLGTNSSLSVSGGTTNLLATQHLAAMNVSGGTAKIGPGTGVVASVKSLSITGTGKVDLQNSKMVVDYTGGSSLTAVKAYISGGSLTSSQLAPGRAIGFGEASDLFSGPTGSFAGQTIDSSSVVIAYTVTADATLDGTVNSSDFNALAAHYGQVANSRWTQGDFDGNGKVNTLDFNLLAANFGQSLPSGASLGSVVPEPTLLTPLLVVAFATRRNRRRSV